MDHLTGRTLKEHLKSLDGPLRADEFVARVRRGGLTPDDVREMALVAESSASEERDHLLLLLAVIKNYGGAAYDAEAGTLTINLSPAAKKALDAGQIPFIYPL